MASNEDHPHDDYINDGEEPVMQWKGKLHEE